LRATAERESAARLFIQLARGQTDLDGAKLQERAAALLRGDADDPRRGK
jgi:hypothetical protein